jgi:hypothetical protein
MDHHERNGVLNRDIYMPIVTSRLRERLRLLAMLLALTIGIMLVTQLWRQPLTEASLATAGRGVLFILLSLGLMGTRRLSLGLTALLCSVSVPGLLAVNNTPQLFDGLEIMTLLLCAGLLLVPSVKAQREADDRPI